MKYFITIATSVLLISCVSLEKNKTVPPYDRYKLYLKSLKEKDYKSAALMLSNNIRNEYNAGKNFNDLFPFFSSIDTVVTNETAHYQKTFSSKSCLTVNGYNSVGEPTTLNFELLNENRAWKFSYVQMMYHESKEEFPSSVKCPPKPKE